MSTSPSSYDAIVLSGGSSSRLGGLDKAAIELGGVTMLNRTLRAVAPAQKRIVVGPHLDTELPVIWCREDPPGSGPVAGVAAGLDLATASFVLVLAVDLPWIATAVPILLDAIMATEAPAVALVDLDGRINFLAAVWRRTELARAIQVLDTCVDASMRSVYANQHVILLPDAEGWGQDCDTPSDLARMRQQAADRGWTVDDDWSDVGE